MIVTAFPARSLRRSADDYLPVVLPAAARVDVRSIRQHPQLRDLLVGRLDAVGSDQPVDVTHLRDGIKRLQHPDVGHLESTFQDLDLPCPAEQCTP